METVIAQIRVLSDEVNTLKNEIVTVKGSHANLHHDHGSRLVALETKITNLGKETEGMMAHKAYGQKPLIKPE